MILPTSKLLFNSLEEITSVDRSVNFVSFNPTAWMGFSRNRLCISVLENWLLIQNTPLGFSLVARSTPR